LFAGSPAICCISSLFGRFVFASLFFGLEMGLESHDKINNLINLDELEALEI